VPVAAEAALEIADPADFATPTMADMMLPKMLMMLLPDAERIPSASSSHADRRWDFAESSQLSLANRLMQKLSSGKHGLFLSWPQ
jgi:hypothetical protein